MSLSVSIPSTVKASFSDSLTVDLPATVNANIGGDNNIYYRVGSGNHLTTLASGVSSGTSFTVTNTELTGFAFAVLSAGVAGTAELFTLTADSSGVWTTDETIVNTHSAGAAVLFLDTPTVPVTAFGAVVGSGTDNSTRIQSLINALALLPNGGVAYFPASSGYYYGLAPLQVKSKVALMGDGEQSAYWNNNSGADVADTTAVFIGNHHPKGNTSYTWYACNATTIGDQTVTTTAAANAGNFAADELIFIASTDRTGRQSPAGVDLQKPIQLEVNRVTAVNAGTGAVSLAFPLTQSITGVEICKPSGTVDGMTAYLVDRALVSNMAFGSTNGHWTLRGAMHDTVIENITVLRSITGLAGNAFSRTQVKGLRGVFQRRGVEIKTGAHNSAFTDFILQRVADESADTDPKQLLNTGENNRNLIFANLQIFGGATDADDSDITYAALDFASCSEITVVNCILFAPGMTGPTIRVRSSYDSSGVNNITVANCYFYVPDASGALTIGLSARTGTISAVSTGADTVTLTCANTLVAYMPFRFTTTGTLPGGLSLATTYYFKTVTDNEDGTYTGQLHTDPTDSAVDITSAGSGTHSFSTYYTAPSDILLVGNNVNGATAITENAGSYLDFGNSWNGTTPAPLDNAAYVRARATSGTAYNALGMTAGDVLTLGSQTQPGNTAISTASLAAAVSVQTARTVFSHDVRISERDTGAGAAGPLLGIRRNSNGTTPTAGTLLLQDGNGTSYYVFVDTSGVLRIHSAAPTTTAGTVGVVVGTQT